MANKFVEVEHLRTLIQDAFPSIPEEASFYDFILNKIIDLKTGKKTGGAFGSELRDYLADTQHVEVNFSINELTKAGWSKLEADIINTSFHKVIGKHTKSANLTVVGDKLNIVGGYKGKKPFAVQGIIFKDVLNEAYNLIQERYQSLTQLDAKTMQAINKELKDAATNDEPLNLVYQQLSTGTKLGASGKKIIAGQLEKVAYTRFGILTGKLRGPKLDVHAGHLEGLENFRLAGIARVAVAAFGEGFTKIDDSLTEKIAFKVNISKDIVHSLFTAVYKKIKIDGAYDSTKVVQHTTMELGFLNVDKQHEKILSDSLAEELLKEYETWARQKIVSESIVIEGNSPSIIQIIENFLIRSLTGDKARTIKRKIKPKEVKKYKPINITIQGTDKAAISRLYSRKRVNYKRQFSKLKDRFEHPEQGIDTLSLRNLINEMLPAQVEELMASSSSSDGRLRYQTGRFADSTKLLTLTRTQAGVLAGQYTYQRDPYDVFLPEHKLGTPKRDPRIYVEGAIRNSAISILKNRFPGIQLELK